MLIPYIQEEASKNNITILPGFELTVKEGSGVHILVIFPEDTNLQDIDKIVTKLLPAGKRFKNKKPEMSNLDIEDAIRIIQEFKDNNSIKDFLIAFAHADSENGVLDSIEGEVRVKLWKNKNIKICQISKPITDMNPESFKYKVINNIDRNYERKDMAYFLASDCRSISKTDREGRRSLGEKFTWIKADPTFLGLMQAIKNPSERFFLGEKPPIFSRIEQEPSKFIDKVTIKYADGYKGSKGKWFKNVEIEFNPGLVAIIGNKGNGKSAITDTIGLCGNSRNYKYFSFLQEKRFCNPKSKLADNFVASMKWKNGKEVEKNLSEKPNSSAPEEVNYLPQNYFELLTADIDGHMEFESKIKNIIFQYLPEDRKYGMDSLDELIEFLSENTEGKIYPLVKHLENLNREIVDLEIKRDPNYLKSLKNEKEKKEREIKDLQELKSKKEERLKNLSDSLKNKNSKLKEIKELEDKENNYLKEEKGLKGKLLQNQRLINELLELKNWIKNIKQNFEYEIEEKKYLAEKFSLNLNEILKIEINLSSIDKKLKGLNNEKTKINEKIERLKSNINKIKIEKDSLSKSLIEEEKIYQKTLDEIREIEIKISNLIGNENEYKTLKWIEKEIRFIENELNKKINDLKIKRLEITLEIYDLLKKLIDIYDDLKKHVDDKLKGYIDKLRFLNYNLEIDAKLELQNKEKFIEEIINYIDKRSLGYFRPVNSEEYKDTYDKLNELISEVDFNKKEDIKKFLINFINKLEDGNLPIKQVKGKNLNEKKENLLNLYNLIFAVNKYIKPFYMLKLGDKPLEVLSPGEKGAILLIFYLMLDKDNTPLVIDQPEENLDNESIFKILVDFIKEVKNRRQLILVTHNPNLAVVSDADQILHLKIDRQNENEVKIKSGSLENPEINKIVTDILEGTLKAFKIRDERYIK